MAEPGRLAGGLRFAVTTLTIVPVRMGRIDRATAAVAMSAAPAVGALLGAALAGVGTGAVALGTTPLVAAVLIVAAGALLTRGLHLDGLADTADGLGSYGPRGVALEIMRKPDIGPLGVVVLVLTLLAQVAGAATVLGRAWLPAAAGVVTAVAGGRVAISLACRRGLPAARPDGLGALVAGTVGLPALAVSVLVLTAVSALAVPGRPWQGPLAVAIALVAVLVLLRHARSRLGGVTGDVIGAACEIATTVIYVIASI